MQTRKKFVLISWIIMLLGLLGLYLKHPNIFEPKYLANLIEQSGAFAMVIFLLCCMFRNITMIPSTFFTITGTMLFPEARTQVFLISVFGTLFSSILIYYFSDWLGLDDLFKRKYPKKIEWLENKVEKNGLPIVIGWTMFPFVPTDLICYVAGVLKMPIWKYAIGMTLGAIPVVAFYVFIGGKLSNLIGM